MVCGARTSFEKKTKVAQIIVINHWQLTVVKGVLVGILTALLQVVTAFMLVGWFWSIM